MITNLPNPGGEQVNNQSLKQAFNDYLPDGVLEVQRALVIKQGKQLLSISIGKPIYQPRNIVFCISVYVNRFEEGL